MFLLTRDTITNNCFDSSWLKITDKFLKPTISGGFNNLKMNERRGSQKPCTYNIIKAYLKILLNRQNCSSSFLRDVS